MKGVITVYKPEGGFGGGLSLDITGLLAFLIGLGVLIGVVYAADRSKKK
jgi:hypothetical protein